MNPGTLLIRADASPQIGWGHAMRCLALAQAWQDRGGRAVFAMAETEPAIEKRLKAQRIDLAKIAAPIGGGEDLVALLLLARERSAAWIVLDGYGFHADYESRIKNDGLRLLVVDDLGRKSCGADVVLNQNLHAREGLYAGRARLLLGTKYALLRREFAHSSEPRSFEGTAQKLLVMTGGSEAPALRRLIVRAIAGIDGPFEVRVVVPDATPEIGALKIEEQHKIVVVPDPQSIRELMLWADLAIATSGSTVWEMCAVGLPSILISIADNQIPVARELAETGAALYCGSSEVIAAESLLRQVREALTSPELRARMSRIGRSLVDGHGAERVVKELLSSELKIRRAVSDDCMLLWQWVNDPGVRAASFRQDYIAKDEHVSWFRHYLDNDRAIIYVAEDSEGIPVGQFRVEWEPEERSATIDLSIAPEKRGAGFGANLLTLATQKTFEDSPLQELHAYIRPENAASLKAFEKAGFQGFDGLGSSVHCYIKRG